MTALPPAPVRQLAAILGLFVLLQGWHMIETVLIAGRFIVIGDLLRSQLLIHACLAAALVLALARADAKVDRGAHSMRAYGEAIILASAGAAALQYVLHGLFDWTLRTAVNLDANRAHPVEALRVALTYLTWSTLGVYLWASHRERRLALERMGQAQLGRARLRRAVAESRLQSLQARVEPQFLFDVLRRVSRVSERDPSGALQLLERLVAFLRVTLPPSERPGSTLGRELALLTHALALHQGDAAATRLTVEVSAELLAAAVPPMLLMPLVQWMSAAAPAPPAAPLGAHVEARPGSGALELTITMTGPAPAADAEALRCLRDWLHAVFGERATLAVGLRSDSLPYLRMVLPDEHPTHPSSAS